MPKAKTFSHPDIKGLAARAHEPVRQVWSTIAADIRACAEEAGEPPLSRKECVEAALDGNQMSLTFPQHKELEAEIYGLNSRDHDELLNELVALGI